jgi:capsular exopolysaccharide synthesis family protein
MLLLALGVMGGLGAGIGLAFLWENLDNSVHSSKEIEQATGLATLGLIPVVPGKRSQGFLNGNSLEGEAFHILRASLFAIERDTQINTLLVTSANPGAGKSTVIANLALAMAHVGRKIVVVDGDLRLPAQHERFQLPNKTGLGNFLEGNAALPDIIQKSQIDGVDVITSGALPENPAELLSSAPMTELLNQLSVQYDLVLVDAPALLSVSDASSLSLIVDAVLLVVGYDQACHKDLQSVRQRLTTLKARPVGIVVNKSARDESSRYYKRT